MAIQLRTIIPDKPMRLRLKNLNLQQNEVTEGGVELEFRDKRPYSCGRPHHYSHEINLERGEEV
jgi:hypothetical protein